MKSPLNRGGLRFYLVIIALVAGTLMAGTTSPSWILAGLPFLLSGVWLHTWAKGCLRQNRVVARIGPYRFVRHPFYLANALIDTGLVVMAGWWPLALALPLWWLAIYIPVIRGEERYLAENFPDEYPAYRLQVPCLIPWRRPLPQPASGYPGDGFLWNNPNIAGGEELPRAARILAYPLLFFVVQGLRSDGLAWFNDGWNLTALAGLAMLYVLAWELHGHQRQQRWILPLAMRGPMLRVAMSAAALTAVCYISAPRTSYKDVVPISGAVLMLLSVPVYSRRPTRAIMAEILSLLGTIAAGELLWLGPALVVTYAAWILDFRLASVPSTDSPSEMASCPPFWPYLYPVVAVASAALIGVKLIGHGLPYHTPIF
ncbi:MAG: methyltransferase family protein [Thermoguttaceae bacterium]